MVGLLKLIAILLPTIAVITVVYLMLKSFVKHNKEQFEYLRNEQKILLLKIDAEKSINVDKVSLPLKFQAYERMALFLERVNPPNLITRVLVSKMSVGSLHVALLANVRDEYEHNMSQQLYVSEKSWKLVVAAKEDVVRLINSASAGFDRAGEGSKFAQAIIQNAAKNSDNPIEKALAELKKDIRNNFA